jgi:hypothetical protein
MAHDNGSPVRKALVAILDAKPDPAHLDALLAITLSHLDRASATGQKRKKASHRLSQPPLPTPPTPATPPGPPDVPRLPSAALASPSDSPVSLSMSRSRTLIPDALPVRMPISASGIRTHQSRICASSVVAPLKPLDVAGDLSGLQGNTGRPCDAYRNASSSGDASGDASGSGAPDRFGATSRPSAHALGGAARVLSGEGAGAASSFC